MPANPERGELDVTIDGDVYTLRPSFDAICQLEPLVGKSFDQILEDVRKGWMSGLRSVVWLLLQAKHANECPTLPDASAWIERAGGPAVTLEHVYKVFGLNLDEVLERAAGGRDGNPLPAPAGISEGSLSAPSVPD